MLISAGWLIFMVNAGLSILAFRGFLETQWLLAYPIGLVVEALCFAIALSTSLRLKDKKNQALTHQLSELAYTDTLTGLLNRPGLKRELYLSDAYRHYLQKILKDNEDILPENIRFSLSHSIVICY